MGMIQEEKKMNQGNERTTSMSKTKGLVQMAIFAALIVVLAFTPFIGYIPLGFTRATIIHIPVIMGSLMLGPKKGRSAWRRVWFYKFYQ